MSNHNIIIKYHIYAYNKLKSMQVYLAQITCISNVAIGTYWPHYSKKSPEMGSKIHVQML